MSSVPTTQKHRNFVGEPMKNKPATAVPGIGTVLGSRFLEAGFDTAYSILGQFLLLKKDEELFCMWFRDTSGGNRKHAKDCYSALLEWCEEFL